MKPTRDPVSTFALILFLATACALTVLGFMVKSWLPPVASDHGVKVDRVIYYLLIATGGIFIIGHVALIALIWKNSRRETSEYKPVTARTELLWALIPVGLMAVISEVGVIVLGLPVWQDLYGQVTDPPLEVEVVGKQFEWLVRYPGKDGRFGKTRINLVHETRNPFGLVEADPDAQDDVVLRGVLRLPVGRTVLVRLRSHDVQHSFTVPAFRIKQDLVPGLTTQARFKPTVEGEYDLACAELCGLGHYQMKGTVLVLSPEAFTEWLGKQPGWFE